MTAMVIAIGGGGSKSAQTVGSTQKSTKKSMDKCTEYERIWCPGEFYRHKKEFNSFGDTVDDKEKLTLDRFMRLFEADCKNTGWNMHEEYENALLQKVLYVNDLITNLQQRANLSKSIKQMSHKMERLEKEKGTKSGKNTKKRRGKRKTMDTMNT